MKLRFVAEMSSDRTIITSMQTSNISKPFPKNRSYMCAIKVWLKSQDWLQLLNSIVKEVTTCTLKKEASDLS